MHCRYWLYSVALLLLVLGGTPARAQPFVMPGGPGVLYFGPEGGWTQLTDHTQAGTHLGTLAIKHDDGFNVGARLGYEWGPLRFEEEYSYRYNKSKDSATALGTLPLNGQRSSHAIMTNAIYDFAIGWPFSPHVGVGVGAVQQRLATSEKIPSVPSCAAGCTSVASSDWEFGYQGIAGIRYNINPALAFDLDYRYLATTDPTFRTVAGFKFKASYETHNVVASLTYRFGAPPPAAPAPPPPPVAQRQVFLVFFDWDRDAITSEGMRIVQQAADAWRAGGNVTIQVTGYTDASGSVGYNQRLSERRANNVAAALARFGVPRQAMLVSGRGKADQRVPTADGVREPQNRRVEIVFP
jgi:OOP family OmpA-OmpF porin